MICDPLLDEIQCRLSEAERLLMEATPETVNASAAELDQAVTGMTDLMRRIEDGRLEWSDTDKQQLRSGLGRARWRLSRIARLVQQAGEFYQGWGRRLCEQAGYALNGSAAAMPELVRAERAVRGWEG